jgi:hypothetical protein
MPIKKLNASPLELPVALNSTDDPSALTLLVVRPRWWRRRTASAVSRFAARVMRDMPSFD